MTFKEKVIIFIVAAVLLVILSIFIALVIAVGG